MGLYKKVKEWILWLFVGATVFAAPFVAPTDGCGTIGGLIPRIGYQVEGKLAGKGYHEMTSLKADVITRENLCGEYEQNGFRIEILSVRKINDGIEILARAWKGTSAVGFGTDGSVEIERFQSINPPTLIDDPTGDIIRKQIDEKGNIKIVRILREDPVASTRQALAHTISVVAKNGTNIVTGKIGNTTSTFYPDADTETTSVDGYAAFQVGATSQDTWANVQGHAGNDARDTETREDVVRIDADDLTANTWLTLKRGIYLFDTSAIPDTDTISSATVSSYVVTKRNDNASNLPTYNWYSSAPASNTALVAGDYDSLGTTPFATAIAHASIGTGAYNNWTLNATGISNISKTGITKFGLREATYDAANVEPTWVANQRTGVLDMYLAEQAGTANDPKLVVEHAVAAAAVDDVSDDFILFE